MTPSRLKWTFLLVLFLEALFGRLIGSLDDEGGMLLIESVGLSFLAFLWVIADAQRRGVQLSQLVKVGIVMAGPVTIPIYLVRSRGWMRALRALGVFLLQYMGIAVVAAVLFVAFRKFVQT